MKRLVESVDWYQIASMPSTGQPMPAITNCLVWMPTSKGLQDSERTLVAYYSPLAYFCEDDEGCQVYAGGIDHVCHVCSSAMRGVLRDGNVYRAVGMSREQY